MTILDYTTYDDIRAVLGVSQDDLEDATLALAIYANGLTSDLEEISLNLPAQYTTVKAKPSPTDTEARFLREAQGFATFAVAKRLAGSLPIFAAKQTSDSKVTVTRFENPYQTVMQEVQKEFDRARNRLTQAWAAVSSATSTTVKRSYMAVVNPAYDPVTNT